LEKYLGVSPGKLTAGLGQTTMSFCDDREGRDPYPRTEYTLILLTGLDIYSLLLTAVSSLLRKYSIDPRSIGRLEVGTETLLDKAKSCKSVLMQLFSPAGNTDIEGIDTVHACYGGTNALFNAINWVESSSWDGRLAIVAMGDIALYGTPAARPTGGAGCVAMLIGPDAPLVINPRLRSSYMQHTYDFYKPDFKAEYPVVDGHYSNRCYLQALDSCYKGYHAKRAATINDSLGGLPLDVFDYMAFHAPYCKLVSKSYTRLLYNDYLGSESRKNPAFTTVPAAISQIDYEASLDDKSVEKTFVSLAKERFEERVQPTLTAATSCGNSYTASVYSSLVSLISNIPSAYLQGKTVGVFSYGGGSASTLFCIYVRGDTSDMAEKIDLHTRLDARKAVSPEEYNKVRNRNQQVSPFQNYLNIDPDANCLSL
jgi:hydroxymethylglutaryl-CoA synthase